jgi:hypothetical protein
MHSVAEYWQLFEENVVPAGAPEIQRVEMRRAFYCGFWSALQAGVELAAECEDNHMKAMLMMQGLHDECYAFRLQVEAGKA